MANNLVQRTKIVRCMNGQVAGTSDTLSGSIIDLAGFDGVMFIALAGDLTITAVLTLQAQQNAVNSATGMATLANVASVTAVSATVQDNSALALDVFRPTERFLRPQLVRATANAVIDGVIAILYEGNEQPTTQVIASAVLSVTPVES